MRERSCINMQISLMEKYYQQAERPNKEIEVWENRPLTECASKISWAPGNILSGLAGHCKKITTFFFKEFTYFSQASCLLISYLFSAKTASKFPKRPVYLWSQSPGESKVQKA